jgi:2-polyprenyl-3-methyl-5-hydroxy-6-metoxy-1,4-benzoquinol methylase
MESVNCAICKEDNTTFLFSKWGHRMVQCARCGLTYVNPRSFNVETDAYFEGPYLSTIEENGALRPGIDFLYSQITDNLGTYLKPGRLLDVGCAMGHFMAFARERGWNVHGVECSRFASQYGRNRWGLRILDICDLQEARLPDRHFDACVLIEVAEHLPHPLATFTEIFRLLKPGGMVYVTTPNFASFRSLLQREGWNAVIPSGHLYLFSAETLHALLESIGFRQIVNLTGAVQFDSELDSIRSNGGRVAISTAEIEVLRNRTAQEDAGKLSNGRGDGLVMCAIKPVPEHEVIIASVRSAAPTWELEGKLVCAAGTSAEDQKVYLIQEGRKHWVISTEWLTQHGMRLEDTIQVARERLDSVLPGTALG